jgi:uroporphyrin-III C-methyltransferase
VVAVENCSRPNERVIRLTLVELEQGLPHCEGPVLVMIGEAFARRGGAVG